MREIIVDTETTGLNFRAGDRVIEVGCVELINHVPTGKTLQFYCSVNKAIDVGAMKIHGITNDFLRDHPPFEDSVEPFLNFLKDDILIIHNADFYIGFINNELRILDRKPLNNKTIDTVVLARKTLNTRVANLDYLCRRFDIDLSDRSLHGALLDSHLLAEVYLELKGGKQISMNLNSNKADKTTKNEASKKIDLNLFKIKASVDEIQKHKTQRDKIKNSLWGKIDY